MLQRRTIRPGKWMLAISLFVLGAGSAVAEDTYFDVPLTAVNYTEGELPRGDEAIGYRRGGWLRSTAAFQPYAVLDRPGEVYVSMNEVSPWRRFTDLLQNARLSVRASEPGDVTGRLYFPKKDGDGMQILRFKLAANSANPTNRDRFYLAREQHYRRLANRDIPGGAWYRRQARESVRARTGKWPEQIPDQQAQDRRNGRFNILPTGNLEDTYAVFTGGRAISENLQLDRLIRPASGADEPTIPISSLEGITVKEMDWKALLKDAKPALDSLASYIPADQHAIFFSSFESMTRMIDEADSFGTPLLQLAEPRGEDAGTKARYEKQLCLELSAVSRLLGPQVIASAAATGSDPYLRTGTDLAILFEAKHPKALATFIAGRHLDAKKAGQDVEAVSGKFGEVEYSGVRSRDRSVSSYACTMGDVVVVSNSLPQLEKIVAAKGGSTPALAGLPEYHFFRTRYPRGGDETAFLMLTDAAIRRWCGPKWRIGTSRRTRAAAILAELQAANLDALVNKKVEAGVVHTDLYVPQIGNIKLDERGVWSTGLGSSTFLTPIAEMDLERVTTAEAEAYKRWREGYQFRWRQFFDPIAIQFSIRDDRVAADLSVMPLILGSSYNEMIEITKGVKLAPDAGDKHPDSLLHFAIALNPESQSVQQASNLASMVSRNNGLSPLGWLGKSLAVYFDEDQFWADAAKAEDRDKFFEREFHRLPVALRLEVKDSLRLTLFLTALRAFVEQTAPGLTRWEQLEHNGSPYVRIQPAQRNLPLPEQFALYYAVTPESLLVTLSQNLLNRALDRQAARTRAEADQASGGRKPPVSPASKPETPWLGESAAIQAKRGAIAALQGLFMNDYHAAVQAAAWANIPILNEWRRRFPGKDPVAIHEAFWGTKLLCPAGGSYVWDEEHQTYGSTIYGHPGKHEKSTKAPLPKVFSTAKELNLGVTFEENGLRTRAALERSTDAAMP